MSNKVGDEPNAARVAQALSHPARIQILHLLRDEGAYVMHLTTVLGRPQANISQHLAILREAGLVTDEREGMTVVYRVRDARIFDLIDRLIEFAWPVSAFPKGQPVGVRGHGAEPRIRRTAPRPGGQCHCPRCAGQ